MTNSAKISQYANGPTLDRLISDFDGYINPSADFEKFQSFAWDIRTAQAWGLDILGRIVGVSRILKVPYSGKYFGFNEAGGQPFGQYPFYTENPSQNYALSDDAYRKLILLKAALNINDVSTPSINSMLSKLFAGRGRCYVNDLGNMQIRYTFEFAIEPYELSILTQSGALPRPAGVGTTILTTNTPYFGFSEAGENSSSPFGYAPFISEGCEHAIN